MTFLRKLSHVAVMAALISFAAPSVQADGPATSPEKEAELIAVLKSDKPDSEKAITCKLLAIYGSSDAVPELAKLLPNEQLSSWARIALEAIPGPEADEALRKSTDSLSGLLLVGSINSIGVRRVASATDQLSTLIRNQDADVAMASAVALGRIGNDAAAKTLRESLASAPEAVKTGVAEGCVLCAERFAAEGREGDAVSLYDDVRKSKVPPQRVLEATRGAILARKQGGLSLLMEQFHSSNNTMFQLALGTAREFPGSEIDQALAKELKTAVPDRAALIIGAMADRKSTVDLIAVADAAAKGPKIVRLAAIDALGEIGNTSNISLLLNCAIESDNEIQSRAKKSLAEVPGEAVDKDIVTRLAKAEGKVYPVLIEQVGLRRISAIPALLKAVENTDKAVRTAALTALGATVPEDKLSVLIKQVVSPKFEEDQAIAQTALKTACVRMPNRETCATELSTALDGTKSVPTKISLLKILAAVGGTKALGTIGDSAKDADPDLQDVGSELLGDWGTIDAAPVMLDLAKTAPSQKYQIRAMRGYIKVVRQFTIDEPKRMEMCQLAFAACQRPAEHKLMLDVYKRYPTMDSLKLALKTGEIAELKDDAGEAALTIVSKIQAKHPEARDMLTGVDLAKVKLEIVKAEYGAAANQKDVTEVVRKQAADSRLVSLPSSNYNELFGGDPAPNTPKKLKIQYKINDKTGEASFDENALIILPMPK